MENPISRSCGNNHQVQRRQPEWANRQQERSDSGPARGMQQCNDHRSQCGSPILFYYSISHGDKQFWGTNFFHSPRIHFFKFKDYSHRCLECTSFKTFWVDMQRTIPFVTQLLGRTANIFMTAWRWGDRRCTSNVRSGVHDADRWFAVKFLCASEY